MDRIHLDLDQDGRKDLLLVRGREVSVFLQRDGVFRPGEPDQKFNFVDTAILWDDGDVDGDGRPEILFLTTEGVQFYRFEGGRLSFVPRELHRPQGAISILKVASREEIRHKDFHADMDGDRLPDLLLPGEGCFLLFRGLKEGGFGPPEVLGVRPDVHIEAGGDSPTSQAYSSFWYPQPVSGEFDGQGRRDIFIHQRERIAVFCGSERAYGPAPTWQLPLEFKEPLDEGRFKLDHQLPTKFADVDGDGLTDIVATHLGRATTYVFRGRKDRRDLATPDAILKLKGITFLDFLVDLDGDGKKDLILARTDKPGLWDIVKVLVTKEVPLEVLFFYGGGEGLFPRNPEERRELVIPFVFSSSRRGVNIGTSAVVSVLGDLTGDGVNDLILNSAPDKIAVYAGKKGRGFSEDEDFEIEVPDMEGHRFLEPIMEDLNGDGIDDLSLAYYSWEGDTDRLVVLLSPGAPVKKKPPIGMTAPAAPVPAGAKTE